MLQKDIGYYIKNINDKLKVKVDADLKHYHLTLSQSRVLTFLITKGGTATQKEIEVFMEVSHPTIVGIISRMEQHGHVICHMDGLDKRNKIVTLSEQSQLIGEDMQQRMLTIEKNLLSPFSEAEIRQLKSMLSMIYESL